MMKPTPWPKGPQMVGSVTSASRYQAPLTADLGTLRRDGDDTVDQLVRPSLDVIEWPPHLLLDVGSRLVGVGQECRSHEQHAAIEVIASTRPDESGRAGDVDLDRPTRGNGEREGHAEGRDVVGARIDRLSEVEAVHAAWRGDVAAGDIEREYVADRHGGNSDAPLGDVDDRLVEAIGDLLGESVTLRTRAGRQRKVWTAIEPLLPDPPGHPLGCHRPRIDDQLCFRGILIRLVTGASWVDVESILDFKVSDTTLRTRRDEWIAAGVFDQIHTEALAAFDKIIGLDLTGHRRPC